MKKFLVTAKVLKTFLLNIAQNLNISRFKDFHSLIRNIKGSTLKAILKLPSIIAIECEFMYVSSFNFFDVNEVNIEKEIVDLNGIKACKNSDIPTKVIK